MTAGYAPEAPITAWIRRQTIISIFVSMAFSAGFFLLVFGGKGLVAVWSPDYLALDFLPQSGICALTAALIPALQTRSAIRRGDLPGSASSPRAVVGRALVFALIGLVLAAIVIAALRFSGIPTFPWGTAFAVKVAYGGLLGLAITPPAVRAVPIRGGAHAS